MLHPSQPPRHKVFLSFHRADMEYKEYFLRIFSRVLVDHSVGPGDIADNIPTDDVTRRIRDEYIRDATVTIVLIGGETWKRKHVDWEIDSSLRDTRLNSRTGLLGILLPTYRLPPDVAAGYRPASWPETGPRPRGVMETRPARAKFWPHNIPPRLWDNAAPERGFAVVRPWPLDETELAGWVHEAFLRRTQNPPPSLARYRFGSNRLAGAEFWTD